MTACRIVRVVPNGAPGDGEELGWLGERTNRVANDANTYEPNFVIYFGNPAAGSRANFLIAKQP
jgi:hypothetical protein